MRNPGRLETMPPAHELIESACIKQGKVGENGRINIGYVHFTERKQPPSPSPSNTKMKCRWTPVLFVIALLLVAVGAFLIPLFALQNQQKPSYSPSSSASAADGDAGGKKPEFESASVADKARDTVLPTAVPIPEVASPEPEISPEPLNGAVLADTLDGTESEGMAFDVAPTSTPVPASTPLTIPDGPVESEATPSPTGNTGLGTETGAENEDLNFRRFVENLLADS